MEVKNEIKRDQFCLVTSCRVWIWVIGRNFSSWLEAGERLVFHLSFCWECNKPQGTGEDVIALRLIKPAWEVLLNSFKLHNCQIINKLCGIQGVLMNFISFILPCSISCPLLNHLRDGQWESRNLWLFPGTSSTSQLLDSLFLLKLLSLMWKCCLRDMKSISEALETFLSHGCGINPILRPHRGAKRWAVLCNGF